MQAHLEAELLLNLVQEVQRVQRGAVHLVDKAENREAVVAAHLKQLPRLRLQPFAAIDEHERIVGGAQGAVGVHTKVRVPRRVQKIQHHAPVVERHCRAADADATLPLNGHEVAGRVLGPPACAHLPSLVDGAPIQQQLLRQRRLASIRVLWDGQVGRSRQSRWRKGKGQ
jgi:hypothetical protein